MVHGLALAAGQRELTAIVNTGDDGEFFGLLVCPEDSNTPQFDPTLIHAENAVDWALAG